MSLDLLHRSTAASISPPSPSLFYHQVANAYYFFYSLLPPSQKPRVLIFYHFLLDLLSRSSSSSRLNILPTWPATFVCANQSNTRQACRLVSSLDDSFFFFVPFLLIASGFCKEESCIFFFIYFLLTNRSPQSVCYTLAERIDQNYKTKLPPQRQLLSTFHDVLKATNSLSRLLPNLFRILL